MLALVAVIAWQLRQIIRSAHPSVRAVEALAFSVPLHILLFATAYFLMAHANVAASHCPFHVLADQNRELVCSLNRELVQGIVTGLGNRSLPVTLAPVPNGCCVRLGPAGSSS